MAVTTGWQAEFLLESTAEIAHIAKAGKNLILLPQPGEVETLLDNLSCRGLQLIIDGLQSLEEADEMMKLIEKHSADRVL